MHEPELLILDEPIAGLDPLVQQSFHALLREVAERGANGLPVVAHAVGGRAGRRPGRDPASRRLVVVDSLDEPARVAVQRLEIEFGGAARRAEELRALPGVSEVAVEGTICRSRSRARPTRRQGGRRARGALDPQPRRRPRGDLPPLLPGRDDDVSRRRLKMTLRLRLLTTLLSAASAWSLVIADGRRAVPGGRATRSASSTFPKASPPARRRRLRNDHRLDAQRDRLHLRAAVIALHRRSPRRVGDGRRGGGAASSRWSSPTRSSARGCVLAKAAAVAVSVGIVALGTCSG